MPVSWPAVIPHHSTAAADALVRCCLLLVVPLIIQLGATGGWPNYVSLERGHVCPERPPRHISFVCLPPDVSVRMFVSGFAHLMACRSSIRRLRASASKFPESHLLARRFVLHLCAILSISSRVRRSSRLACSPTNTRAMGKCLGEG